jgi:dTDP-4-amino-4,6-dideoxygalactose transaminase
LAYEEGDFPVAEKAAAEILSLPMYPQLKPSEQKRIVQEVTNLVAEEAVGIVNLTATAASDGPNA